MKLKEILNRATANSNPFLLAVATTGLKPESDELIAVAISDSSYTAHTVLMRQLPAEKLAPAQQYHGISPEMVLQYGVDDNEFTAALTNLLGDNVVLTYRPSFQQSFLDTFLQGTHVTFVDLPLMIKFADSRFSALGEDNMTSVAVLTNSMLRLVGSPSGFKQLCGRHDISLDSAGVLPCEASCRALQSLWSLYDDFDVPVFADEDEDEDQLQY